MSTHAHKIIQFYQSLSPEFKTGEGIVIMNPYRDAKIMTLAEQFYHTFYADNLPRSIIFGINPGRFGGGITGIPFTDPVRLQLNCGIDNDLPKKSELSSLFVYQVIENFGGPVSFYNQFFITAMSPLGFVKNGRNLNYYDDLDLMRASESFVVDCIYQQRAMFGNPATCFCLGEGTNFKFFSKLNAQHRFFKEIIPLPHPRWIMQYRRKSLPEYINRYLAVLNLKPETRNPKPET